MQPIRFLDLYDKFMEFYQDPNCPDFKKKGTLNNYGYRRSKIAAWLRENDLSELPAESFTIGIAKRMYRALVVKHGINHSARIVKMAAQVLQFGIDEELITFHPLAFLRLKRDRRKQIVHLTPEELAEIQGWEFRSRMLNFIRDLFVVSCYTGMDYGDTMAFMREPNKYLFRHSDDRLYIIKPREKCIANHINEAIIPVFEQTRHIIERYQGQNPHIANATYNRILKEIMWVMGFEKRVSTHTGRKTFAMIMLNWEMYSIEWVSKAMGHVRVETTERHYAQVNIHRISKELDRHGELMPAA